MKKNDWEVYEKEDLINDLYQYKVDNIKNKVINISLFDSEQQKKEEYKLLKGENELLLCKKEIIKEKIYLNNFGNIKIGELFNNEYNEYNEDYYYINKDELKQKYLHNLFELDENINDVKIDNNNKEEMDKLYKEMIMKHPRKIVSGIIEKYSFFSWTGFFCFKQISCLEKNEFNNLPFGISSYFKTIKLFIFTFLIISLINLIGIIYYSQHKSIFENLKFLQKTTLSNTMTTTYNSLVFIYNITHKREKQKNFLLSFKCNDNKK